MTAQPRLTNFHRQIAIAQKPFERKIQDAVLEELNRLKRDLGIKLYSANRDRQSGKLKKDFSLARQAWEKFREKLIKKITTIARDWFIKLHDLYSRLVGAFGYTIQFDADQAAKDYEMDLMIRMFQATTQAQRVVARVVLDWFRKPGGSSVEQLMEKLQPTFGEGRARQITHTELSYIRNYVIDHVADQVGAKSWMWITKLDERVCESEIKGPDGLTYQGCKSLHGKIFDIKSPMPPKSSHYGCRCVPSLQIPFSAFHKADDPEFESKHPRGGNPKNTGQFSKKPGGAQPKQNPLFPDLFADEPSKNVTTLQDLFDEDLGKDADEEWIRGAGREWGYNAVEAMTEITRFSPPRTKNKDGDIVVSHPPAGNFEIRIREINGQYVSRLFMDGIPYKNTGVGISVNDSITKLMRKGSQKFDTLNELRREAAKFNANATAYDIASEPENLSVDANAFGVPFFARSPHEDRHVESVIKNNDVDTLRNLSGGMNASFIGKIHGDGNAVVKPETYSGFGNPEREVLAYQLARAMGFSFIPPTVYRQWGDSGELASAMEFVGDFELVDDKNTMAFAPSQDDVSQMFIFDIITGNRDRHTRNWMVNTKTGRIAGIDNGFTFLMSSDYWKDQYRNQWSGKEEAVKGVLARYRSNTRVFGIGDVSNLKLKKEHFERAKKFIESPEFTQLLKEHLMPKDVQDAHEQALYGLQWLQTQFNGSWV